MEKSLGSPRGFLETLPWFPLWSDPLFWHHLPPLPCSPNQWKHRTCMLGDQVTLWHLCACQNMMWSTEYLACICVPKYNVISWAFGIQVYAMISLLFVTYPRVRSLIVWHPSVHCDHWLFGTQVCIVITDCLALKCEHWSWLFGSQVWALIMIVWHSSVCTDHDCLALKCVLIIMKWGVFHCIYMFIFFSCQFLGSAFSKFLHSPFQMRTILKPKKFQVQEEKDKNNKSLSWSWFIIHSLFMLFIKLAPGFSCLLQLVLVN